MIQTHISRSLEGLESGYSKNYNLTGYKDTNQPCLFLGMYREEDFGYCAEHRGDKIVVFTGHDSNIHPDWIEQIAQCRVVSTSDMVHKELTKHGIDSEMIQIFATDIDFYHRPRPHGKFAFWYHGDDEPAVMDIYGFDIIDRLEKETQIPIIKAGFRKYKKDDLFRIYENCFINLRLTRLDGPANTNLEMGLMGRRSIYNGSQPNTKGWNSYDDVYNHIIAEKALPMRYRDISDMYHRFYLDEKEKFINFIQNG